jgi:carbonic anhydrase
MICPTVILDCSVAKYVKTRTESPPPLEVKVRKTRYSIFNAHHTIRVMLNHRNKFTFYLACIYELGLLCNFGFKVTAIQWDLIE